MEIMFNMADLDKIRTIFKDYPYIVAAYLFGSYALDKTGPMSDVDIAILVKKPHPEGRELIHEEDYLAYKITKTIGVKEVDLIDINRQELVFQHNILRTGKLIYDSDPEFRVRFEAKIISKFCDLEPVLRSIGKFYFQGIRKRIARI